MIKLIRADFYKTFHRAAYYVMLLAFCGLALVLAAAIRAESWDDVFSAALQLLIYPAALLPMLTQIVLGEEYREHTIKNTLSFGTNRCLLFCSKWVSTVLFGMILTAAVFAAFFGGSAIFLPHGAEFSAEVSSEFFRRLGAACFVYVACATMSLLFLIVFNRNSFAIFLYYGAIYLSDLLLHLFHLGNAVPYLLKTQLENISGLVDLDMQKTLLITAVTMAVFFAGSLVASREKDLA